MAGDQCSIVYCDRKIPLKAHEKGWGSITVNNKDGVVTALVCPTHIEMFKSTWLEGRKPAGVK